MYKYEEAINIAYEETMSTIAEFAVDDIVVTIELVKATIRAKLKKTYYKNRFDDCFDITENFSLIDKRMNVLDFDCTDCDYEGAGLYFVGMCGFNPITNKKYYLVKVGSASNIKNRLKQYLGMNPMIYNNNNILPMPTSNKSDREYWEYRCHSFLRKCSYAMAAKADEWFYVDEEKYFELCSLFADREQFLKVAKG